MVNEPDSGKRLKVEIKQPRVVSDGTQDIGLKCTVVDASGKTLKDEIPVTISIKKHRFNEEITTRKGIATFRFKPTKPTGKTQIIISSTLGVHKDFINVVPTPYQYVRDTLQAIVFAFIIAFGLIRPFILQTFYIPSGSMEPTLYEGDRLVGFMFTYRMRDPRPGEIVIFEKNDDCSTYSIPIPFGIKNPSWKSCKKYIKRTIAVGGDTVEVRDMTVYVNGKPLDEPYVKEPPYNNWPPFKVPEHSFFMMGDNRNNSLDSRYWGALPEKYVIAKAIVRYWPLDRICMLKQAPIKTK